MMNPESTTKKRCHSETGLENQPEEREDMRVQSRSIQEPEGTMRSITLDMSKYTPTIQALSDDKLVKIFEIGVLIKESFTLTVCENNTFVKQELATQMEPIHEKMDEIQNSVKLSISTKMIEMSESANALKTGVLNKCEEMKDDLVKRVEEVAKKVPPVDEMENRMEKRMKENVEAILDKIEKYKDELSKLTQQLQKPAIKGSVGEKAIMSILRQNFRSFTFQDVSYHPGKGDIHVQTPEGRHFLIEVKNIQSNVPKKEIEKFKRDVFSSPEVKVGLLFSLKTGIATKSQLRKFEVDHDNKKYLIYVPNASDQEEIVIWSVSLANELAGLDVALDENQAKKLQKLFETFQENVRSAKSCREKMETLKRAMVDLENSVKPMLEMIENAKKKINEILKA